MLLLQALNSNVVVQEFDNRMFSSCPICQEHVPANELEWHANNHFVEDQFERDMELARQISLAPPSHSNIDPPAGYVEHCLVNNQCTTKASSSGCSDHLPNYEEQFDLEISCLVGLQIRSPLHKVEDGLMNLLQSCISLEKNSRSIITSHVDHYQSNRSEDTGWGCGWRNIQMLSSHILRERPEVRDVMFGGSGFVPNISSLQRWLEIAWKKGFDTTGSNHFNHEIYGSRKWIGTTECAALFRSFGLRARIVDFDSTASSEKLKNRSNQIYGPMDRFLQQNHVNLGLSSNYTVADNCISGHQVLINWIWNYFTSKITSRSAESEHVTISDKTPLYFQHDGHSRTIVGIQKQCRPNGSPDRYFLLILDPAHRTEDLERSLRDQKGWQRMIKRGVDTLKKKPQYQLCYIDPGIAHAEELWLLKTIDSILVKF